MLWVARDRNGKLFFHTRKPVRAYGRYTSTSPWGVEKKIELPFASMPYVQFEDGPVRVTIKSLGK